MTVYELILELEDMDPDAEVRLAIQPSYPFQHQVDGVITDDGTDEWGEVTDPDRNEEPVVYIGEGGQLRSAPYLPATARDALGW